VQIRNFSKWKDKDLYVLYSLTTAAQVNMIDAQKVPVAELAVMVPDVTGPPAKMLKPPAKGLKQKCGCVEPTQEPVLFAGCNMTLS